LKKIKTVISRERIEQKVRELGAAISNDYKDRHIILICNLKGAFIFLADLCRVIESPISIDFIATTSYKGTESTGNVRIIKDLKMEVRDKDILIVEDIVDTGHTLEYIIRYLKLHGPRSVRVCTLLDKQPMRSIDVPIDYCGFQVDDRFVIGYGLDFEERYRELDFIGELDS
jgi:hypoxanthine phosphoribosyltransferase